MKTRENPWVFNVDYKENKSPLFHEADLEECQPKLYERIEKLEKSVRNLGYFLSALAGSVVYIILDQFVL